MGIGRGDERKLAILPQLADEPRWKYEARRKHAQKQQGRCAFCRDVPLETWEYVYHCLSRCEVFLHRDVAWTVGCFLFEGDDGPRVGFCLSVHGDRRDVGYFVIGDAGSRVLPNGLNHRVFIPDCRLEHDVPPLTVDQTDEWMNYEFTIVSLVLTRVHRARNEHEEAERLAVLAEWFQDEDDAEAERLAVVAQWFQ